MVIEISRAFIKKENILKNSFMLFRDNGYSKTTTREIASASCINKGLLHYYYKQKEDIILEMFTDILTGIKNYLDCNYKDKIDGLTYYATLNILFMRTMNSKQYFSDMLYEMMMCRTLTKIKIAKTVDICYDIITDYNIPITKYQLNLAVIAAVGAEAELILSMKEKKIKMTYDKLATTINKLLFTMLKISENEIKITNEESTKIADTIDPEDILLYLKQNYTWLQD
ncbi:TetR/AcrR family transcriptional regulator [Sedimentibacter sp.]|uniref:TetR/AcrR family transcriptional regulator n=1 Tax=Sedimentibacter sp. TaxID=1960295 RepID=UPI0028ACA956|nr:TetR/AcrR family transcriptional regulator [Sedimentibacter sp.]